MRTREWIAWLAAAVALVAAGWLAWQATFDDDEQEAAPERCAERLNGHIGSLEQVGDRYRLRFDPLWLLTGETANVAAVEDGVIEPGDAVPNDYYRVEEGHRLLTFFLPPTAEVAVLTRDELQFGPTPITVAQLAQLVAGEHPVQLFESLESGIRIQVEGDTVCSLEQLYVP